MHIGMTASLGGSHFLAAQDDRRLMSIPEGGTVSPFAGVTVTTTAPDDSSFSGRFIAADQLADIALGVVSLC